VQAAARIAQSAHELPPPVPRSAPASTAASDTAHDRGGFHSFEFLHHLVGLSSPFPYP
jgi:hypothetical protein